MYSADTYRPKPHLLTSPTPHLLHSNNPVSDDEYALIISAISRVENEMALLKELERSKVSLNTYFHRLHACQKFLDRHKVLLHWARRLPTELLENIFLLLCEGEDNYEGIPWNVSHVCHRWRSLALSIPQLWRKVPLCNKSGMPVEQQRRLVAFLPHYLTRSRGESLVFSFDPSFTPDLKPIFLRCLLDVSERWGNVTLNFPDDSFLPQMEDSFSRRGNKLLALYSLKTTFHSAVVSFILTHTSTALKRLIIHSNSYFPSGIFPIAKSSCMNCYITHFTGAFHITPLPFSALSCCPCLEEINIKCLIWSGHHNSTLPITFASCRRFALHISYCGSLPSYEILDYVEMPMLEDLYIAHYLSKRPENLVSPLISFLKRHSSTLISLHWRWLGISAGDGVEGMPDFAEAEVLQGLKELQVLRLTRPPYMTMTKILTSLVGWSCPGLSLNQQTHFSIFPSESSFSVHTETLPSLRRLDIGLQMPSVSSVRNRESEKMSFQACHDICQIFATWIRALEERPSPRLSVDGLAELRVQFLQDLDENAFDGAVTTISVDKADGMSILTPLDFVFELEGWNKELKQGWETQVKLEREMEMMTRWNGILEAALDRKHQPVMQKEIHETLDEIRGHTVLDVLSIHATGLHRSLKFLMTKPYFDAYSQRAGEIIAHWAPLFLESSTKRKWVTADDDSILFVSPDSPLRMDAPVWMFGVSGYSNTKLDYLDPDFSTWRVNDVVPFYSWP